MECSLAQLQLLRAASERKRAKRLAELLAVASAGAEAPWGGKAAKKLMATLRKAAEGND